MYNLSFNIIPVLIAFKVSQVLEASRLLLEAISNLRSRDLFSLHNRCQVTSMVPLDKILCLSGHKCSGLTLGRTKNFLAFLIA